MSTYRKVDVIAAASLEAGDVVMLNSDLYRLLHVETIPESSNPSYGMTTLFTMPIYPVANPLLSTTRFSLDVLDVYMYI